MNTRKEKYQDYRNEIMNSSSLKEMRLRVIKEMEENRRVKKKYIRKEEDKKSIYSLYLKKRNIKIFLFSLILIIFIVIIIVGIYFGVKSINVYCKKI